MLLLAAGLVLTVIATWHTQSDMVQSARHDFDFAGHEISLKVRERLQDHEQILRGGAGLFAASEKVSRAEWRAYVQSLQIEQQLPGIQGMGYSVLVQRQGLERFVQEVQREGFAAFRVWPEGERETYSSIIYLEPFTNRNVRAFGYDMFSEAVRHEAMERARDQNAAALSAKVKLVQETATDVQAGTLMFVPVYRNGLPLDTVAERRAAFQGWVYSPYRMSDLMKGILGEWALPHGQRIRLQAFDGPVPSAEGLLYDTQKTDEPSAKLDDGFTLETPITYAGRRWTLRFTQGGAATNALTYGWVWAVAAGGTVLSFLLAGLLYSLRNTRHNARRLAAQLTADLQHTTERLALAAEAGGVGIWDYDVAQDTLIWDDEMFRLYGVTRARFSGAYEAWAAGVHPDDRQRGHEEIQQALRGEKEFDTEFRVLWPEGTVRHIRALARVQRNAAGQPMRMLGTNWDITERKQAEEALRAKTTLLTSLLSSLPDVVFFKDGQGRYLGCNPEFARFVNRSVPSIVGSTDYDLLDPATAAAFRTQDLLMLDYGKPRHNDEWLTYPDGTRVLVDTLKAPLRDGAGQVIGLLGVSRDITERKLAEEKLYQLSRAVEQSPVSIMITDPAGAIQYVNPRFIAITGYTLAEVLGCNARLLKSGATSPQAYQEMWQTITAGRDWHGEFHNRKKNGDLFWESASISPVLNPEGRLTHFVAVKEDITARKQAEEELLRTLATERELSALKSKFVTLVSHEFRTPLSAILGASEILEDFYDRLAPEKRIGYFQMIRQEIQRLTGMLQDVLLQGQLDAGRVLFHPQSTDVIEQCQSIAHRVQAAYPKHPPVVFEADAPGLRTMADESLLERVLSNLLTNAFKYSPALTPVRLTVRRVGEEWEIQVQDQGIGIPEPDQADIFSAFRRGGNVGSIKGTGVGLYIVKKCAQLQGGRLTLHSQAGQGSTFTFHFPWQPVDPS